MVLALVVFLGAVQAFAAPNVVLITVDTLRADHLSSYGYHLRTSPNIDRLASEGVRFDRAYTTIPLTGPAHYSLFLSRFPQEHGARINGVATPADLRWLCLPQILRTHGYRNAAFISAWPLTSRLSRLDQWFDHYDQDLNRSYQLFNSMRWAEDVTPPAIEWLNENTHRPFFLWVHYFDPHAPYNLREEYATPEKIFEPSAERKRQYRGIQERVTQYDSEIGYADHYIGELLGALDHLGLRENTIVVLTSDHGESLGEHRYVGHGRHLYENIARIPLIFRYPGKIQEGSVVGSDVSLVDITPTLVDLALKTESNGVEIPVPFGGRSLASAMTGEERLTSRPARYLTFAGKKGFFPRFLSWLWVGSQDTPLRMGFTHGSKKVIWTPGNRSLSVYNLAEDPYEKRPRKVGSRSADYERETAPLDNWFRATAIEASEARLTEEDLEILKSLGYLQ